MKAIERAARALVESFDMDPDEPESASARTDKMQPRWQSDVPHARAAVLAFLEVEAAERRKAHAEIARLREALDEARAWHEHADKALSKSGRKTDADYSWRRHQHQEQMEEIAAAIRGGSDASD